MKLLKNILHLILIIFLTVLTQVGGLIWFFSVLLSIKYKKKKRFVFPLIYLLFNLIIIPPIAKLFGRERLPVFNNNLKPRNWAYPLMFRNYVKLELKELLVKSSEKLKEKKISITYLDANFPFIDGFPLLPHLSHNDGNKIDISYMYLYKNGKATNKKPSVSGYGIYANSENNYTSKSCKDRGHWQYDFSKYLTFGAINDVTLDGVRTKVIISELLSNNKTQKIFIEPHLKQTLGLNNQNKIRFQSCQAVRHDDHIHLQIK